MAEVSTAINDLKNSVVMVPINLLLHLIASGKIENILKNDFRLRQVESGNVLDHCYCAKYNFLTRAY